MKNKRTICYVAGKSGGHIIPCLTLAHEEREKSRNTQILFFTTEEPLDLEITSSSQAITWHVPLPLANVSFKNWLHLPSLLFQLGMTICKTFITLVRHRPVKLICTGGGLAIPVVICARILAIPVQLYELNVEPGRATRFLASWSIDLFTCFAETQRFFPKKRCYKVAYPIRFFDNTKQISQQEALDELFFEKTRKTILILGGSQGSVEINRLIHDWLVHNPHLHDHIQIIHQTGRHDTFNWQRFYQEHMIPARLFSFSQDLALDYSAADLVICRSGAGILFEVLFFGKPCITIPLETPDNKHQVANACAMQQEYDDLFTVIRQEQMLHTKELLYQRISELLDLHQAKNKLFIQPEF